ncbi:DUF6119 family protein [Streptomyces alkaliterrae]|uniref:DUF6119 family protein n=1 Tax=Streptomyces alkaliterrae TaxID=2213162 RepID=UPI002B201152|nr:DUF6119 family protein [Streptomyces alkaliterrae]
MQTLRKSPEARERFAEKVTTARKERKLPEGFRPSKALFAILLKGGTDLTADTLFPLSQVTLMQTARTLEAWDVQGIASTPPTAAPAGIQQAAA